jgi:truncated hemoglobin YjbI
MRQELKDISTESDVSLLVNTFYTKVRGDALLFAVFDPIVKEHH